MIVKCNQIRKKFQNLKCQQSNSKWIGKTITTLASKWHFIRMVYKVAAILLANFLKHISVLFFLNYFVFTSKYLRYITPCLFIFSIFVSNLRLYSSLFFLSIVYFVLLTRFKFTCQHNPDGFNIFWKYKNFDTQCKFNSITSRS